MVRGSVAMFTTGITLCGIIICITLWLNYVESYDASFIYLLDGIVKVAGNHTFAARPASFGPLPPLIGSRDPLVASTQLIDGSGCFPDDVPPLNDTFALVIRGGCSFYQKVLNLQRAGAKAVIVGNNIDSNLISMYSANYAADISIPSVFVSRYAFQSLQEYTEAELAIVPQPESIVSSMVLFVLSPLLSVSFVYSALAYQRYRDRVRLRAPKQVVDALPIHNWEEIQDNIIALRECAICLDDFDKHSKVMVLPCHHGFHVDCVSRWLLRERRQCPLCRHDVGEQV